MNQMRNQVIRDQTLTFEDDIVNYLGPNLELDNCSVILRVTPKSLVINDVKFTNCRVDVKKRLTNFRWSNQNFSNCKFYGHFRSNDFENTLETLNTKKMQICDFSGATLDGCRFIGIDMRQVVLPKWPCVTIFNSKNLLEDLKALDFSGDKSFLVTVFEWAPENLSAVTFLASQLAKATGSSEEQRRIDLEKLNHSHLQTAA